MHGGHAHAPTRLQRVGIVGDQHGYALPRPHAVVVVDVIVPGVAHADVLALALGGDDDRPVFAALRHPDHIGHAAEEQPVFGLHARSLQGVVAPIPAVVRKFIVDVAFGVADDLVHHDVLAVAHPCDDGHAGAQRAVGDLDGIFGLAPRLAAVVGGDDRQRLIEARVGVRPLVGEGDGDPAVFVEVDVRLPHGAERVEVLLDGRPALDDGRAEFPRLGMVAADIKGKFGRSKVERHRVPRKHDGARGQVAALLRQFEHHRLKADAVAVLRVFDLAVRLPSHAPVRALHDGHDGRLFDGGMVKSRQQRAVELARVVQLHDARIQYARRVLVHLFVARGKYDAHVHPRDLDRHKIFLPIHIFTGYSIAHISFDFNKLSKIARAAARFCDK